MTPVTARGAGEPAEVGPVLVWHWLHSAGHTTIR